jgi:hypothetical protein
MDILGGHRDRQRTHTDRKRTPPSLKHQTTKKKEVGVMREKKEWTESRGKWISGDLTQYCGRMDGDIRWWKPTRQVVNVACKQKGAGLFSENVGGV